MKIIYKNRVYNSSEFYENYVSQPKQINITNNQHITNAFLKENPYVINTLKSSEETCSYITKCNNYACTNNNCSKVVFKKYVKSMLFTIRPGFNMLTDYEEAMKISGLSYLQHFYVLCHFNELNTMYPTTIYDIRLIS